MRSKHLTAFAALLSIHSCVAFAQWWDPADMTPPYLKGTPQAPKVVYDKMKIVAARSAISNAMWNGDFAKIERMHDEFVAQKIRATDGSWMVYFVQSTFDSTFMALPEERTTKVMEDWAKAMPASKLRPVIEALRWQRLAWNARGGSFASATPDEAMQVFRERLAKSARALEASAETGKESPIWYWVALIVAGSSGAPAAHFDALFEEAVTRFPAYQPLYQTRVNYLLPQWGGDYRQVDAFIDRAVTRTSSMEGESFYVWLYADLASKLRRRDFFEESAISWPRMKRSFEDLVRRYPDAYNKAQFLTFACRVRDKETTARLIGEMGKAAEVNNVFDGITLETCRRFALQAA
jgi:hypothetical protein